MLIAGKILIIVGCVAAFLFILSLVVYYFNLDMKLASKIRPVLEKRYDKIKRNKTI